MMVMMWGKRKKWRRDAIRQEQTKIQQTSTDCLWQHGLCHSLGQFEELDKVVRVNGQSHVHSKPNLGRVSDLVWVVLDQTWGERGRVREREEERAGGNVEEKSEKEKRWKKEGRELEKKWPTVKENWQWMLEPTSARCHRSDVARCHSSRTLLHWDSAHPRGERSVCVCSQ